MQICMRFYDQVLKQQICYSFTLLISIWILFHLKWWCSSFRLHQIFPILMVQMLFPQIQQAHSPNFRNVGKSLISK